MQFNGGAFFNTLFDQGLHFFCLDMIDQWSDKGIGFRRIAHFHQLHLGFQQTHKFRVNFAIHYHAVYRQADLPLMQEATKGRRRSGLIYIGISQHDHHVVATQFQNGFFHVLAGDPAHMLAGARGTGKRNQARDGVLDKGIAHLIQIGYHHVQYAGGQTGRGEGCHQY